LHRHFAIPGDTTARCALKPQGERDPTVVAPSAVGDGGGVAMQQIVADTEGGEHFGGGKSLQIKITASIKTSVIAGVANTFHHQRERLLLFINAERGRQAVELLIVFQPYVR